MATELEELVEFLHHGNTAIRQTAAQHLVPFSKSDPSIFRANGLIPVKDLKLLVKDYAPIAENALTILINISSDKEVLKDLTADDAFLESLVSRITNPKERNANAIAMLLANMAKSDSMERLITLKRPPPADLSKSIFALDQLMDCFVRGAHGAYNKSADFDYLAYLFADLAKHSTASAYLITARSYDGVYPLAKLLPFSTSSSHPRRLGVAAALKNAAFTLDQHASLLRELNVMPYVLLPLASGADSYSAEETDTMLPDLQFLEPSKEREKDVALLKIWLEVLMVLTGTRDGRGELRSAGAYFVVRECHAAVEDEEVRELCDRLVQTLMRGEEGEEGEEGKEGEEGEEEQRMVLPEAEKENTGVMVTRLDSDEDEFEQVA